MEIKSLFFFIDGTLDSLITYNLKKKMMKNRNIATNHCGLTDVLKCIFDVYVCRMNHHKTQPQKTSM